MKRMTEITFETEELVAVKARQGFKGFCQGCNAFVEMLPVEAAAILTGLSEREIFRLIETGEIHFVEAERVFVCRDSSISTAKRLSAAVCEERSDLRPVASGEAERNEF